MKNKSDAGTYAFGKFIENEKELERLITQAQVGIEIEKTIWSGNGLKKGMKVLDLGCGPGVTSCEFAKIVETGHVTGVDISKDLIDVANYQKEQNQCQNLDFMVGNAYDLNLQAETFDFSYARFFLQHLEEPLKVLHNVKDTLKSGGVFCAIDIDDSWLSLYPAPDAFDSLTEVAAKHQQLNGGDRYVGRKMGAYLHQAGFSNIQLNIIPITSQQIGLKNFLDITSRFKLEVVKKDRYEKTKEELDSIYKVLDNDYAWGAVGLFVVSGIKTLKVYKKTKRNEQQNKHTVRTGCAQYRFFYSGGFQLSGFT
jgi:ubiquinone/menaquinone biosynthesis C-methylase UbiE